MYILDIKWQENNEFHNRLSYLCESVLYQVLPKSNYEYLVIVSTVTKTKPILCIQLPSTIPEDEVMFIDTVIREMILSSLNADMS